MSLARRFHLVIPVLAVLVLANCGAPTPPQCKSVPRESKRPTPELIAEAHAAWQVLSGSRGGDRQTALTAYNDAVSKLFDQLRCPKRPWDEAAASLGTRILPTTSLDIDVRDLQVMFPARTVDTKDVGERHLDPGVGVPVVGWNDQAPPGQKRDPFAPPTGQPFTITALLRFDKGAQPAWEFCAPLQEDDTRIGGRSLPLAADWSAANSFYWKMSLLDNLTVQTVLLPDRFQEETGLYFAQPYDPDRIPVVLVHGVNSSPATFRKMVNRLASQKWFREKYQVWFFAYPTGNPWIVSATSFRHYMNEAARYARSHGDHGNLEKTVVVAHSMGGLVTRTAISTPGTAFYDCYFKKPLDQLKTSEKNRQMVRNALLYKPVTFPDRIVYLAVPHKGSPMAERIVFTWLSRLVRLPKTMTVGVIDIAVRNASAVLIPDDKHLPTGIDTLSPNDASVKALQHTVMPPNMHYHSVIGDRGRGDTPDSSDGIVPYWSSHLDRVDSEKIVPSGHSVPANSEGIEEVNRILRLHAGLN